jgi:hypothetical protein
MTHIRPIDAGGRAAAASRRGVLLLIVLSMLTLFMMLGAAYLAAATRARTAARAHARLTFGGDEVRTPAAAMLDGILMRVLASGTSAPPTIAGGLASNVVFESLLADKYGLSGTPLTGTATAVAITGPIVTATVSLNTPTAPADLNGRVLTFVEPGRPATSHRIVRAIPANNRNDPASNLTVVLDRPFRTDGLAQPRSPSRILVNGREFTGDPAVLTDLHEAWDGFDDRNPFLARVAAGSTVASSTTSRISYFPRLEGTALSSALNEVDASSGLPKGADNDGDGGFDGLFLDWSLPKVTDRDGNELTLEASVLVIDLDGRFNVNAHGSWASLMYAPTHAGWTTTNIPNLSQVPMGSGYGPPDIAANAGHTTAPQGSAGSIPRLFDRDALEPQNASPDQKENPKLAMLSGAASDSGNNLPFPQQRGRRPPNSRYTPEQPTARLPPLQGKYGDGTMSGTAALSGSHSLFGSLATFGAALPGFPGVDDPISRLHDRRLVRSMTTPDKSYGMPQTWWNGSPNYNWHPSDTSAPAPRGVYNSPPDLHGRMKTLTVSGSVIAPRLVFAQPEWAGDSISLDDPYELLLDTRRGVGGWLHDPYEPTTIHQNPSTVHQNPFTLAELEGVLRPYDIDASHAPARLAALLGTTGESSRLRITTESWDTTAIVGGHQTNGAARCLQDWLDNVTGLLYDANPLQGVIAGEVSRWERFDLNRALAPSSPGTESYGMDPNNPAHDYHVQRQAYFKDLYVLLVALKQGGNPHSASDNKTIAQWAANVVEFRDADSRVMPFEYDVNPQDGWSVDGLVTTDEGSADRKVVWGAERPEMVIQQTLAWRKDTSMAGMLIGIHRPWNAEAYTSGTTAPIAAEPCDTLFDTLVDTSGTPTGQGRPSNQIDLGKKAHPDALASGTFSQWGRRQPDEYPIWRLRLASSGRSKFIRFDADMPTTGATDEIAVSAPSPIGPDDSLVVYDSLTIERDPPQQPITVMIDTNAISVEASSLEVPSDWTGDITLHLERFSDPAHAPTKAEWDLDPLEKPDEATSPYRYVAVDSVPIVVIQTGGAGGPITSPRRGGADPRSAFWKSPTQQASISSNAAFPTAIPSNERDEIKWFPWPNRPYISAAELLFVPQGNSREILEQYEPLTPANQAARGVPVSLHLLFDAVHVPSRFPGVHSTTDFVIPPQSGVFPRITTIDQMSAYREPGRVNLNTITSEEVWNAVIAGPLPRPLVTGTQAGLGIPATSGTSPRAVHSMLEALSLQNAGTAVYADPESTTVSGAVAIEGADQNPLHTLYTATRLANTVTPRSHMYAVWITLRESVTGDPDSAKMHRGFYIVDRSLPVAFEPDQAHNIWDSVRLRRIIE